MREEPEPVLVSLCPAPPTPTIVVLRLHRDEDGTWTARRLALACFALVEQRWAAGELEDLPTVTRDVQPVVYDEDGITGTGLAPLSEIKAWLTPYEALVVVPCDVSAEGLTDRLLEADAMVRRQLATLIRPRVPA